MATIAVPVLMETSGNQQRLFALFEGAKNGQTARPDATSFEQKEPTLGGLGNVDTLESSEKTKSLSNSSKRKMKSKAKAPNGSTENRPAINPESRQFSMKDFVQIKSQDSSQLKRTTTELELSFPESSQHGLAEESESRGAEYNLDPDPNFDRRKRARTATPENDSQSLVEGERPRLMLEVEGSLDSHDVPGELSNPDNPEVETKSSRSRPDLSILESNPDGNRAAGAVESIKSIEGQHSKADDSHVGNKHINNRQVEDSRDERDAIVSQTLQKKSKNMLVLNARGRFSPQKPPMTNAKCLPTTPSQDHEQSKRGLIAKISYENKKESTESICEKIEAILNTTRRSNIKHKPVASTTISTNQKKPTHPFFSGKRVDMKESRAAESEIRQRIGGDLSFGAEYSKVQVTKLEARDTEEIQPTGGEDSSASHASSQPGPFLLFSGPQRITSHSGGVAAPWPAKGQVHTRGLSEDSPPVLLDQEKPSYFTGSNYGIGNKKLKTNAIRVNESEDVLQNIVSQLRILSPITEGSGLHSESHDLSLLNIRRPERMIISGPELQKRVHVNSELLPNLEYKSNSSKGIGKPHAALERLFQDVRFSLTPYDKSQCEITSWSSKYAPRNASEILQGGREALILRDWLKALTINVVDKSSQNIPSGQISRSRHDRRNSTKSKRKKRKRAEELDDFIVSSEEEADQMSELLEIAEPTGLSSSQGKPSMVKFSYTDSKAQVSDGPKLATVVILSGPNGCGKTAAALAVAKELDFEVFEINPGTRRSGKEILERVGDMTQNHLVQSVYNEDSGAEALPVSTEDTKKEIESGRQGTMNNFFKSQRKPKVASKAEADKAKAKKDTKKDLKPPRPQKQSVVLLEEADILFEEDRQFWVTVIALIAQSKRPIIITCNDESLIPIDSFSVHAILRFVPPPEQLALDYLLLVAANEGHLLDREAVRGLFAARNGDLRASIMDLDFWCQIGVGDRKGGLEWIYQRWPIGSDIDDRGGKMRVVSKDTYHFGLGWLSTVQRQQDESLAEQQHLLDAWNDWAIDVEDWYDIDDIECWNTSTEDSLSPTQELNRLNLYDDFLESISAADIHPGPSLRDDNDICLDLAEPKLSGKSALDMLEGYTQIQTGSPTEYDALSTQISLTTKSAARRYLKHSKTSTSSPSDHTTRSRILGRISKKATLPGRPFVNRSIFESAFSPIASPTQSVSSMQPTSQISDLDRPVSLIAEDMAPYIRQIVAFDLYLEQQRRELSNLLSEGGRNGKRVRTTRASRSALEGGPRASTRRERWFPCHLDTALVMSTAGTAWPGWNRESLAKNRLLRGKGKGARDESRSSSMSRSLSSSSAASL